MRVPRLLTALVAVALAAGCTAADDDPTSRPGAADVAAAPDAATAAPTDTPTPTSIPTPSVADVAFGTGTVTVDGTEMPVSGDCDISRAFGEEAVGELDGDVDVLLAVDNVAGDGTHDGPFAIQVRLQGRGAAADRTITSQVASVEGGGGHEATYEGDVAAAELRERRELEFLDVAVLHLEASQQRVAGTDGPSRRELVVDVTCPVSRPG